jgi:hypothetical protein
MHQYVLVFYLASVVVELLPFLVIFLYIKAADYIMGGLMLPPSGRHWQLIYTKCIVPSIRKDLLSRMKQIYYSQSFTK